MQESGGIFLRFLAFQELGKRLEQKKIIVFVSFVAG
jgi:hypothetical protein